jgi:hypothetical protein
MPTDTAESLTLEIKRLELEIQKVKLAEETQGRRRLNWSILLPALAAVGAGLLGYITSLTTTYLTSRSQLELENYKFQVDLILEAVKTGDKEKAKENLRFFVDAGLIDDSNGKIAQLTAANRAPTLPINPKLAMPYDGVCNADGIIMSTEEELVANKVAIRSCVIQGEKEYLYSIELRNTTNQPIRIEYLRESVDINARTLHWSSGKSAQPPKIIVLKFTIDGQQHEVSSVMPLDTP